PRRMAHERMARRDFFPALLSFGLHLTIAAAVLSLPHVPPAPEPEVIPIEIVARVPARYGSVPQELAQTLQPATAQPVVPPSATLENHPPVAAPQDAERVAALEPPRADVSPPVVTPQVVDPPPPAPAVEVAAVAPPPPTIAPAPPAPTVVPTPP